jgi:hypothetical protein
MSRNTSFGVFACSVLMVAASACALDEGAPRAGEDTTTSASVSSRESTRQEAEPQTACQDACDAIFNAQMNRCNGLPTKKARALCRADVWAAYANCLKECG